MPEIGYYVGLLIDVLGQGDKLAEIKDIPETAEGIDEMIGKIKNTYGVVHGIREWFDTCYSGFFESPPAEIGGDFHEIIRRTRKASIVKLSFSDTIVHLAPLKPKDGHNPSAAIYAMVIASSMVMLSSLAKGFPVRGSIEVGIMMDVGNGEFYGPLLQKLNYLEKNVAKWPRIVVGDDLYSHVNSASDESGPINDINFRINKSIVSQCNGTITQSNGVPTIELLKNYEFAKRVGLGDLVNEAYKYVIASQNKYHGDKKLYWRYSKLRSQMDEYMGNWS